MEWPHAPAHRIQTAGTYMVTCGTYRKEHLFRGPERLSLLRDKLLTLALEFDWRLQAWTVFSNHYHFVGNSPPSGPALYRFIGRLHMETAKVINEMDDTPKRKVWFQYWESLLTFEKSYLARLKYVHSNPVKHGLVTVATAYPWCSAAWFERTADRSFYLTIMDMGNDRINVRDDFAPE